VHYAVHALMRQPIVFVGGVHGAGKTTICRLIAEAYPAVHVTAGALIREAVDAGHIVTVGAQDKAVPDVDANQAVLLTALEVYRTRTAEDVRLLLLDGHFSLTDAGGTLVDVPLAVFREIGPCAVLLVETDPATVHQRLAVRAVDAPSPETIARMGSRERECAATIADALDIPIWVVGGDGSAEEAAHTAISYLRSRLRSEA
jgi:adenylate kinase